MQQITLQQVLDAREARVDRQRARLAQFAKPLLSVTLVMPGDSKKNALSERIRYWLEQALTDLFNQKQWLVLFCESQDLITGFEQLMVIDVAPLALKSAMIELEEQHPLGRLWDLDVIDLDGHSLSRQQWGFPPRRCLICPQDAHGCGRSRRHTLLELQTFIADKVAEYEQNHPVPCAG